MLLACRIHMPLQHGLVKAHDTALAFRRKCFIEVLVIWHLIHERKEKTHPERIPDVEQNVLILFGLKEGDAMDLELPERASIKCIQQTMQMPTQFVIEAGDELRNLLL